MQSIAILGCGWLGLPLGQQLSQEGFLVNGSTTRAEKLSHLATAGIKPFLIRIGDRIEGEQLDLFLKSDILFLNIPPGRKTPNIASIYPQKIQLILSALADSSIKKIIFASSTSVYGFSEEKINESSPTLPETASGKALLQAEQLLQRQKQFQVTILRLAGLAGANRHPGRFLAGKKDLPNGLAPVNLVHQEDCIQIIKAIINQEKWGEIYNVCSDKHPTKVLLYTMKARDLNLPLPQFIPNNLSRFKLISNQKVKESLNYTFLHPDPMTF